VMCMVWTLYVSKKSIPLHVRIPKKCPSEEKNFRKRAFALDHHVKSGGTAALTFERYCAGIKP
ncbi:hypothetical protein, partial [Sutterella wadsworthensis]|uniref:hypothetical protein n=1 Tax=Sutterella wadsworthensis TaxID=40545 RepID=UPI002673F596